EGSEWTDERREEHDGQIRHHVVDQTRRADAEDLGEELPLEAQSGREANEAPARCEIGEGHRGPGHVVGHDGEGGAGHTEAREGSPAEDERGRKAHEEGTAPSTTPAGSSMLPVSRTALARMLKSQTA